MTLRALKFLFVVGLSVSVSARSAAQRTASVDTGSVGLPSCDHREPEECIVAYSLTALNVEERMLVEAVCSGDTPVFSTTGQTVRSAGAAPEVGDATAVTPSGIFSQYMEALERISVRLQGHGGWQLATFYSLLPDCVARCMGSGEPVCAAVSTRIGAGRRGENRQRGLSTLRSEVGESTGEEQNYIRTLIARWNQLSLAGQLKNTCPNLYRNFQGLVARTKDHNPIFSENFGLFTDSAGPDGKQKLTEKKTCFFEKNKATGEESGISGDRALQVLQSYYLVAILAPAGSAEANELTVRSGVPLRSMPVAETDVASGNSRMFISVIERNMPYMLTVPNASNRPFPYIETDVATNAAGGLLRTKFAYEAPACIDVNFSVDEGTRILINGFEVPSSGAVTVSRQNVTLTVLRDINGIGIVQYEEEIKSYDLASYNTCLPVTADLRTSNVITLAPFDEEPTCAGTGASIGTLWSEVATYMEERALAAGLKFRDMRTVASAVENLNELRRALQFNDADPIGASRKSADSEIQSKTAAEELWRQGVAQVVSVELQCDKMDDPGQTRFSILARKVDIAGIYNQVKDPVRGTSLDNLVKIQTETVSSSNELEPALRRVIARLIDLPYLRLSAPNSSYLYSDPITLYLEYVPSQRLPERGTPEVSVYRFFEGRDRMACDELERTGRLAGHEPMESSLGVPEPIASVVPLQQTLRNGKSISGYSVILSPTSEGRYLVRAAPSAADDDLGAEAVYRCVDVQPAASSIWGSFGVGWRGVDADYQIGGGKDYAQTPYTSVQTSLALGYGFYSTQNYGNWLFGGFVGTTKVNYSLTGPLSWDYFSGNEENQIQAPEFGQDGDLLLEWQRNSIDMGVSVEISTSLGKSFLKRFWKWVTFRIPRKIVLIGCAGMEVNFGFVHVGEEARDFAAYGGEKVAKWLFDTDFGLKGAVGFGVYATSTVRIDALFEVRLQAVDDQLESWIGKPSGDVEHTVTFDAAFVPAALIRVRYDSR